MANAFYTNYKALKLGGGTHTFVDLDTDDMEANLVDGADYTFSAAHQDLADLAGVEETVDVNGWTTTSGVADSDNFTFTAASGDACEYLILAKNSGTASTSPLVLFMDTFSSGMPITLNGGDVNVTVNASGWWTEG
jgi:hypothetical protein